MEETRAVLPVFSKVIYINKIKLNHKKINTLIGKKFVKAGHRIPEDPKNISSFSESKNILNLPKFKNLKKQIMIILKNFRSWATLLQVVFNVHLLFRVYLCNTHIPDMQK